jgi:rhodanese-related sulfurtransferase
MDLTRGLRGAFADVYTIFSLLLVAALAGAVILPDCIWSFEATHGVRETGGVSDKMQSRTPAIVGLEAAVLAIATGTLVIDARPKIFYEAGHIPGALSLPKDDFFVRFSELETLLERSREGGVIVYCTGGDCEDSGFVVTQLQTKGITNLAIYGGGWEEWAAAGQALEMGMGRVGR